ncbi:uncharacterized protein F5891DRAFT_986455 [Suillus fuscotomentosus]|uniref:Uncharacterized protein n=1 Tax=Suillus fuscotomentosus TaxID=1912939 RepID=A0AAD4HDP7_9AGAM|nr:uncharacterized protein F5891DRAFT_986455 [Suillus fuscotomentosus]KAG1891898.1 hypothetical protein F5891DRAFT_986455 [Suillus fuscotomentosus]
MMNTLVQLALQVYNNLSGASTLVRESEDSPLGTCNLISYALPQKSLPVSLQMFPTTPWMVQEVYAYLPMLRDVLAWQNSSHWTRPVGHSFVLRHFKGILRPFIGYHVPALCSLMYAWGVVITGSCALEMLTGEHHNTDNLNLVVPQGSFNVLQEFILETLNYRQIMAAITEDVFNVVTSSPTTGDMVFMTPGGVAAFYPDLTFEGIVILNNTMKERPPGTKFVGCMKHAQYKVYDSTCYREEPCGHVCPALWRNIVDGDPGGLVLEWDSRYSIRLTMAQSHTSWRLAEHCNNVLCPLNPVINTRLPLLPKVPSPADQSAMREQEARMHHHHCVSSSADYHMEICSPRISQGGMSSFMGVLYATRAYGPELVPIPLRNGLTRLGHINNLEVLHWVDCLGDNKFNVDMARMHKTYNIITLSSSPAYGYGYTFYIIADVHMGNAVMGNVLVVKHISGNKHAIVDLTIADLDCINEVLRCPSSNGDIMYDSLSNQRTPTLYQPHVKSSDRQLLPPDRDTNIHRGADRVLTPRGVVVVQEVWSSRGQSRRVRGKRKHPNHTNKAVGDHRHAIPLAGLGKLGWGAMDHLWLLRSPTLRCSCDGAHTE